MKRSFILLLCALCAFVCSVSPGIAKAREPASSQDRLPPVLRDVGIDQKLNSRVPLGLVFRDESGNVVRLGQYFRKKPVILALVYYDCPMLCTIVLNNVLQSLKELKFNVGQQFEVVTVSFDPSEKPSLAAAKKAIYVGLYGRLGAAAGWHFLTGDEPSIRQLTQSVGFRYNYDPQTRQYLHVTGIMILTPDGRVAKYFYGIRYPSKSLRLGLIAASQGKVGSWADQALLYCSQYDPETGKYSLIVSRVLKISALATVFSLAGLIVAMSRGRKNASA